ncbi:MAG TPA: tetratricopeptide repeat protein [Verrucomicrobiae bacterium]|jgi:tetratricopeptide (TPR) repeat protein|nr:tetratricopeptide repeat protein [Verrucomicrobiae bacterium]
MQPLEPPDSHFVSAALGWLELGNWREAAAELEAVAPALSQHAAVLRMRYEIHAKAGQWDLASEDALTLSKNIPDEPDTWTKLAYATRRKTGGGIPPAKAILAAARQRFPAEALIAYNLACYECQLGNLPQARALLREAFQLENPAVVKQMCLDDPDLEPLRQEIKLM